MILGLIALVVLLGFGNTIFDLVCPKIGGERCCLCFSPKSPLELASECVVARCENGCNSAEVENIKSLDFSCSNYCDPVIIDFIETDRVCGFQFPIVIELEGKGMKVRKSTTEENYQCFAKYSADEKELWRYWTTEAILSIKDDVVQEYKDPERLICPSGRWEDIGDFTTKDEGSLIVYGDNNAFVVFENSVEPYNSGENIFGPRSVTFVTDEWPDYGIYPELSPGKEQEIALVFEEYFPLEYIVTQNTGIMLSKIKSGEADVFDKCTSSSDILVRLDVLCDGRFEGEKWFCLYYNEALKEHTICDGTYKIRGVSSGLPSDVRALKYAVVFSITRLK